MRFLKLGATALAGVFLAVGAMAPAALAQQPIAQVSKAMGPVFNEVNAAIAAKDWATAKAKLDAVYGLAKTPNERLAVEQTRVQVAANAQDWAGTIAAVNAVSALNLLPVADMKAYRAIVAEAYKKLNDTPNYLKAQKAYLDQHGGTHQELAVYAQDVIGANDNATAVAYIDKAIAAAKDGGAKPPEAYYRIKARALYAQDQLDAYYAVRETTLADYPAGPNTEAYWRELISRAQKEPKFGRDAYLDLYRTLMAAGVKLTTPEKTQAVREALVSRGLPNEALELLEPAIASGELSSQEDKDSLAKAKSRIAEDKSSLAKETKDALAKNDTSYLAKLGEAHMSYGDYAKAIEVLQAALTKGIADTEEAAFARLHLGIAQFRAGQADAARATWDEVKSDNGATVLAKNWTLISKIKI